MESNIADHQYFAEDPQLSEPHFDEEATLLSARPVVPLGDVPPESRSGKRLAFGLAIVVAILAGAGATLFYQRGGEESSTAIEDKGTPVPDKAISEGGALSGASGAISPPQTRSAGQNVSTVNPQRKVADSGSRDVPKVKNSTPATSPDSLDDERELRREDRMEERRSRRDARREAKREGREQRRRASDDLLRIREIFEGSPRP